MKLCGKFYKRVLTNEIIFGSIYIIYQLCDKKKGEDSRISTPKIWIDLYSHNTRVQSCLEAFIRAYTEGLIHLQPEYCKSTSWSGTSNNVQETEWPISK